MDRIWNYIRLFYYRAKNTCLYYWFVSKKDVYDWDYSGIYSLLRWKLSRMEPIIKDGYAINSNRHAKQIKSV